MKKLKPKKKVAKVKVYKIPVKTANSAARKSLKWKLKETRVPGTCLKAGCTKTGVKGVFCKKHKKILRKEQLRLNNIPWRKKKAKKGYVPDQPHVVYGGVATKYSATKTKLAIKRVKDGKSILNSVKELEAALAKRKAGRKAEKVKAKAATKPSKTKTPAPKAKIKPKTKPKTKKDTRPEVFVKIPVKHNGKHKKGAMKEVDLTDDAPEVPPEFADEE